jgi:hypothetical protein
MHECNNYHLQMTIAYQSLVEEEVSDRIVVNNVEFHFSPFCFVMRTCSLFSSKDQGFHF